MEMIARFIIVPFCLATRLAGLILSLGTQWGLFRHYWIIVKLLITVLSTIGLLVHMRPIRYLAGEAGKLAVSGDDLRYQIQLVVTSSAALLARCCRPRRWRCTSREA